MAEDINSGVQGDLPSHPVLATIVSHVDPAFMGTLEVSLLRPGAGNTESAVQIQQVKMISPFFGSTGYKYTAEDPDDYNNTQKSYGMWFVPPDVGTTVLVVFVNGDPSRGYWLGCLPDEYMNFSVPGFAATEASIPPDDASYTDSPTRLPVAEYNKRANALDPVNPTKNRKPTNPGFANALDTQGLLSDDIRGITTSSARREAPSMVFGISTPGPVDKKGPKDFIGKEESQVQTWVSRLGGTSFVMDDGDAAFQRKTLASDGPPEYASVENQEEGLPDVPHNELMRIRTRTGHQILLHNSEDLIYIGNARGTTWIELTSDGKIDIYAEDSISVHTKQDMNFYAERDINMQTGRNLNIKVGKKESGVGDMHLHVEKMQEVLINGDQKVQVKGGASLKVDQGLSEQIGEDYNLLANKNWNIKVGQGFNLTTLTTSITSNTSFALKTGDLKFESSGSTNLLAAANINTTAQGSFNLLASSNFRATSGRIDLNGPAATPATPTPAAPAAPVDLSADQLPKILKTISAPDETNQELAQLIVPRVPMHEPWPLHENLDPLTAKPAKTDRDANGRYDGNTGLSSPPEYWKKYSTPTDTFDPIPPAE